MFAWIDRRTPWQREKLATAMLAVVVCSVLMSVAGSALGAVGDNGGVWLLWTGLAATGLSIPVSGLIVWRGRVMQGTGRQRLQNLDAQKRDLVDKIRSKGGGVAALTNAGICRYCGWFATHKWEPSPAAIASMRTSLLVHEAQCEHQPGRET